MGDLFEGFQEAAEGTGEHVLGGLLARAVASLRAISSPLTLVVGAGSTVGSLRLVYRSTRLALTLTQTIYVPLYVLFLYFH